MPELVSIVIVSHNNWPDLELAISSALHQSYPSIEVILVDNESTDQSLNEVERLFAGRVLVIRKANIGHGAARNIGFQHSRGEYIQFLDGDDFLAPNKIEKQAEALLSNSDVDIAYGKVCQFQSPAGAPNWKDWDTRQFTDMLKRLIELNEDGPGLTSHSVLFRRSVFEKVGLWDEHLYVCDQDYWLRAANAECRFRFIPEAYCFYRRRPGQMSDHAALVIHGLEEVWSKAVDYIDREPYHSMLSIRLSRLRYQLAFLDSEISAVDARKAIAKARSTSKEGVSLLSYAAGILLTLMPGGRALAASQKSPWRSLRRIVAQRIGVSSNSRIHATVSEYV